MASFTRETDQALEHREEPPVGGTLTDQSLLKYMSKDSTLPTTVQAPVCPAYNKQCRSHAWGTSALLKSSSKESREPAPLPGECFWTVVTSSPFSENLLNLLSLSFITGPAPINLFSSEDKALIISPSW